MPGMDIGHVHLRVSDLDRSVAFHRDVLGFELRGQLPIGAAILAVLRRVLDAGVEITSVRYQGASEALAASA